MERGEKGMEGRMKGDRGREGTREVATYRDMQGGRRRREDGMEGEIAREREGGMDGSRRGR